jgi:hypothetical protein
MALLPAGANICRKNIKYPAGTERSEKERDFNGCKNGKKRTELAGYKSFL